MLKKRHEEYAKDSAIKQEYDHEKKISGFKKSLTKSKEKTSS